MKKDPKYVNTSNTSDTEQFKILEDKKVKYGIRRIRQTQFFPGLSYNEPYLIVGWVGVMIPLLVLFVVALWWKLSFTEDTMQK